jgi:hypothetical protein
MQIDNKIKILSNESRDQFTEIVFKQPGLADMGIFSKKRMILFLHEVVDLGARQLVPEATNNRGG